MARSIRHHHHRGRGHRAAEFDDPVHRRSRLREIDDAASSLDKAAAR